MKSTKVDLLLPVHGAAPFLQETLNSIFANNVIQTELLVILDRCIRDDIDRLVKNAPDNFTVVILQSPEPGIVPALNLGIKSSGSKFIARIDSDDLMVPDRILTQVEFLEANSGVVCLGSQLAFIDGYGNSLGHTNYPTNHTQIIKRLKYQNTMAHPAVMFRRSIISAVGGYRPEFTGAEDYELWTRMVEKGNFHNHRRELTRYRYSEAQYSRSLHEVQGSLENNIRICSVLRELKIETGLPSRPATSRIPDQSHFKKIWMDELKLKHHSTYRKLKSIESLNQAWKIWGSSKRDRHVILTVLKSVIESINQSPSTAAEFIYQHFRFHSTRS